MLNSTGFFVKQIISFDLKPSHVLFSYDVVSLFTNIPSHETMDIVCIYIIYISTTFTTKIFYRDY